MNIDLNAAKVKGATAPTAVQRTHNQAAVYQRQRHVILHELWKDRKGQPPTERECASVACVSTASVLFVSFAI